MKILIDECLPRRLKNAFIGHEVSTVPEAGWASQKNGELLRLMTGVFDVFVTIDQNLQDQQQLKSLPVRFIVLSARNNRLDTLLVLMPKVNDALQHIQAGEVIVIEDGD